MASMRLGDLLVRAKVITEQQLKSALTEQSKWGGRLGEILVRMSIVTEDMLVKALSKQLTMQSVDLEAVAAIPPHVRAKIPAQTAKDLGALPLQLRDEGRTLVVAMCEPQNLRHLDALRSVSRCRIVPQLAGRQAIARAFGRFYEGEADVSVDDGSFKMINHQGQTLIRSVDDVKAKGKKPEAQPRPMVEAPAAPSGGARSPSDMLRAVEEAQRKEVAALKAMVELLVEKGVFTREEYLAKVKR